MQLGYTPEDVSLLAQIRIDILARADCYRDGETFLRTRYGPDQLHQEAMAEWRKCKDHPLEVDSQRETARRMWAWMDDEPDERDREERRTFWQLQESPKPERWTPAACAAYAIQDLLASAGSTHNDTRAQAVLIVAVLLWDEDAHKRHDVFTMFGNWGFTPAGKLESASRNAAAYFLYAENFPSEEKKLRTWMDMVGIAWKNLPRPAFPWPEPARLTIRCNMQTRVPATIERIRQLPIPDEFKPVFMDVVRYVLANPEQFDAAAKSINADLAAQPNTQCASSAAYCLSEMVPVAAHGTLPAMAGTDYDVWAQRLMLLATLATYPGDLSRFGACGAISWDHGTVNVPFGKNGEQMPLPVPGRVFTLMDLDGTLQDEIQDKAGEYVERRYGELIDGKRQDVVKRTPWQRPGMLRELVDRLKPILDELRIHAPANAAGEADHIEADAAGELPVVEPVDTAGWPRVSEAARAATVDKGEISKACTSRAIHSIGKGKNRRVDPASLKVWTQNRQRGKEVRAAMRLPSSTPPKPPISSGLCHDCGDTVTLRDGKGKCPKCGSTKFDPLARNVAQQRRSTT